MWGGRVARHKVAGADEGCAARSADARQRSSGARRIVEIGVVSLESRATENFGYHPVPIADRGIRCAGDCYPVPRRESQRRSKRNRHAAVFVVPHRIRRPVVNNVRGLHTDHGNGGRSGAGHGRHRHRWQSNARYLGRCARAVLRNAVQVRPVPLNRHVGAVAAVRDGDVLPPERGHGLGVRSRSDRSKLRIRPRRVANVLIPEIPIGIEVKVVCGVRVDVRLAVSDGPDE